MVFLEALKCAQCGNQSGRDSIELFSYGVSACNECDTLICGNCRQKKLSCPRHPSFVMIESMCLSNICIFVIYAPEDELRLIDLQIAGNDKCYACNCKNSSLVRYGIQQVMCSKCSRHGRYWWEASPTSPLERLFCKIISELNERTMPKTRTQQNRVDGMLPVKIVVNCTACKEVLGASRTIMLYGETLCRGCGDGVFRHFPDFRWCDCLSVLIDLIQCIPENQLHLLTYSKWMKAVGCEQHRGILYELNAVSSDGTKTGKLRSFFKKEEISRTLNISETSSIPKPKPTITVKNTAIANDIKPSKPTLTKLANPSIPDKLLPDRITCSCGSEHDLSNMFDCLTCSSYGNCPLCMTKKHWGHEMKESKKTVAFCLINSQSEATRQKLVEMIRQANGSSKEAKQSFEKLCHVLGVVFKDAMLSEDLHLIQSLLTKANTSELEKYFKNAVRGTQMLHKFIDGFCEDLLEAVEEEKTTQ